MRLSARSVTTLDVGDSDHNFVVFDFLHISMLVLIAFVLVLNVRVLTDLCKLLQGPIYAAQFLMALLVPSWP